MASAEFTRAANSTLRPRDWREHCAAVGEQTFRCSFRNRPRL